MTPDSASTPDSSKTLLITGASTGFGRALAAAALAGGHRVCATARKPESLAELAAEYPQSCIVHELDITKSQHCIDAVAATISAWGRLDILINNAGYGLVGALEEFTDEQIRRNVETNFFGTINMIRAALPHMRREKSGVVVTITAIAGFCNEAGFSIYGGSKFGIEGVCEALAGEVRPLGIKVMIVEPGPFRTDFIGRSLEKVQTKIADYDATSGKFATLLGQINGRQKGDPTKAAHAILAAAQDENPPLRLVLGRYAIDKVRKKLSTVEKDVAAWETLGAATDFER
jgi:NAD(P)-dependent dehydrogenase (short-subunit alcohol dehydrogenase family)